MNDIWFTSDHHFGHKNILEYEKEARPFASLKEMHEILTERWNSVVKPNDIVFHLGDFAFGRQNIAIAESLNGKKKIVMGNHDTYPSKYYLEYFDKLYGVTYWGRCILSHIPVHPNGLGQRWLLNVHGHLHSKRVQNYVYIVTGLSTKHEFKDDISYFNVSCEQNNLTPIHADIIRERMKTLNE